MIFIGDNHRNPASIMSVLDAANGEDIVCLGDLGYGSNEELDNIYEKMFERYPNLYTIRGNHDNPDKIKNLSGFIADGEVKQSNHGAMLFIGGAMSPDRHLRRWYLEEEISTNRGYEIVQIASNVNPFAIVSHDGPDFFVKTMVSHFTPSRTTNLVGSVFSVCKPTLSIFGHHHKQVNRTIGETQFVCVEMDGVFRVKGLAFE